MTARVIPLEIEQGATYVSPPFSWHEDSTTDPGTPGDAIPLDGCTFRMQIRKAQQTPVLVEATSDGATPFITVDLTAKTFTIKLPASETDKLSVKEPLYDLEIVLPGGDVFRLMEGTVAVSPNITQMAGEPKVK